MVEKEQRSEVPYVPYAWRTQTSRFVGSYREYLSNSLGGDRTSQAQAPQRRRTTDFWANF